MLKYFILCGYFYKRDVFNFDLYLNDERKSGQTAIFFGVDLLTIIIYKYNCELNSSLDCVKNL